jgi:hypothetical protein
VVQNFVGEWSEPAKVAPNFCGELAPDTAVAGSVVVVVVGDDEAEEHPVNTSATRPAPRPPKIRVCIRHAPHPQRQSAVRAAGPGKLDHVPAPHKYR